MFTVALAAQFRLRTDPGHDARIMTFIVDGIVKCSSSLRFLTLTSMHVQAALQRLVLFDLKLSVVVVVVVVPHCPPRRAFEQPIPGRSSS